jgi:hypothetical protein
MLTEAHTLGAVKVKILVGVLFLILALTFSAQSIPTDRPFGLRSDVLGESIESFRANNVSVIQYHELGKPNELKTRHFPICTNDPTPLGDEPDSGYGKDNIDIQVPKKEAEAGVVYCSAGSWIVDTTAEGKIKYLNLPTIGGVGAKHIRYQFWNRSLYEIDVEFNKKGFEDLLLALRTKYGGPSSSDLRHFQNGFGASIETRHLVWINDSSAIEMSERPSGYTDHLTITLNSATKQLDHILAPKDGDKDL